ncbi:hypothetical protein HJ590_04285 [Naumannella sp. ID2617S]|nr:hypothetical protein [Naumannella sp. ID2617S]
MHDPPTNTASPLRIGSLFSGYGGLDLAVEHAFNAETIWFSEINAPVARVFAHHWPHAPNLGDITRVTWSQVEPVDILTGGFPCRRRSKTEQFCRVVSSDGRNTSEIVGSCCHRRVV